VILIREQQLVSGRGILPHSCSRQVSPFIWANMSPVDSDRNVIQPVFQGSIPRQVTPKKTKN